MKRFLMLLLLLSLIICLCGCGRTSPAIPTPVPAPVQTDAPTEAITEELTETPTVASTEASTEVPTEVPTVAPTEAPTEAVARPLVETVIDYSREIVSQNNATMLTHHKVKCPALTADTADAQAINQEIYDIYYRCMQTVQNYQEGEYIYLLDYKAFEYNGVVAIMLDMSVSTHNGGVLPAYDVYYYDSNTGKQWTYEQYKEAMHITDELLYQVVHGTGDPISYDFTVVWVAADATQTYIYVNSPYCMDDYGFVVLDYSILS